MPTLRNRMPATVRRPIAGMDRVRHRTIPPVPACAAHLLRLAPVLAACLATACVTGHHSAAPRSGVAGPEAVATIAAQARRTWTFEEDGVRFDNRLPAARLHDVTRLASGHYAIEIAPEVEPINRSTWYGFRVRSERARPLLIDFHYPDGYRHRYRPKLGSGQAHWRDATDTEFTEESDKHPAHLQIEVGPQPLYVFAQPPMLPEDFEAWIDTISRSYPVERSVFGHSVGGRPLHLIEFGGDDDSPLLFVVGRQHPPEITGTKALFAFVETLVADTPQARAFRERVRTVVAPLVNPDGLVEGHWRTNLRGKDLNRDWGPFTEPETRALGQVLLDRSETQGRPVLFALDFHSTSRDILYTVTEDPSRAPGGVLVKWIEALREVSPALPERPSAGVSPVFKNWAYCRFGTSSVTYEVGDATPDADLDRLARHGATALAELLSRDDVAIPAGQVCEADAPSAP